MIGLPAGVHFKNPELLWLLLLVPVMIWYFYQVKRHTRPRIRISTTEAFRNYRPTLRQRLVNLPVVLRIISVALIIVAIARPQSTSSGSNITTEGITIVVALDISTSMLAEDFRPNRIEAAKKVAMEFITGRPNDLIGLVVFSGESFTQCPVTSDHTVLLNLIREIKPGMLQDGTAIGDGLATSVARLKDAKTTSKVAVLITDGVNNSGSVPPLTASEIANTFGVRVYSIGVGTRGTAPYPFQTPFGTQYQNMEVQIDEALLTKIAETSGGKYFRATNNKKLEAIFTEIDQMEKSKVEVTEFRRYTEEYLPYALLAFCLLMLELVLRYTWLKSIP
jgi:Ca-activated chloride channel family protein